MSLPGLSAPRPRYAAALHLGLTMLLLLLALLVPAATALGADSGDDLATPGAAGPAPSALPQWQDRYATRFPGCVAEFADPDEIPARLLVVRLDGTVRPVPFDPAWAANQDENRANDLWVVGECR